MTQQKPQKEEVVSKEQPLSKSIQQVVINLQVICSLLN